MCSVISRRVLLCGPKLAAMQSIDSYLEKHDLRRNSEKHLNKLLENLIHLRRRGKLNSRGGSDFSRVEEHI